MKFGLMSHDERNLEVAADAWEEDLREIVAAERLGFSEAWITEHPTSSSAGTQTRADLFICKVAARTKRILLGPGIRVLGLYHPFHVATEAAVCDHLTGGRYMAGFGAGGERGNTLANLGLGDNSESHDRMFEAVDFIVRCWTEPEPFDYHGRFWQCRNVRINPKPLQTPHMPVGIACSRAGHTLEFAADRGMLPLLGHFDPPPALREMVDIFVGTNEAAKRAPRRKDIRVTRYVYVSDSVKNAKDEVRDALMPIMARRMRAFPYQFETMLPASGSLDDISFDYMVDVGAIFVGDPDSVARSIKAAYDETGGFGVLLLHAGKNVGTRRQRMRSMRLFMEEVAPQVEALDPDAAEFAEARA